MHEKRMKGLWEGLAQNHILFFIIVIPHYSAASSYFSLMDKLSDTIFNSDVNLVLLPVLEPVQNV